MFNALQTAYFKWQVQFSSRNAELDQLQYTYGHAQRRLMEVQSQLQRKEIELVSKDQAVQQHVMEVW